MKFYNSELEKIRFVIQQYEQAKTPDVKKACRRKLQKLGFKMSEYGITNITLAKFENLVTSNFSKSTNLIDTPVSKDSSSIIFNTSKGIDADFLFNDDLYYPITKSSIKHLDYTGLYALRLKISSILPGPFSKIVNNRSSRLIYIGKAEGQSLKKRLEQELYAIGHGTFFRSIGAVLGYLPPKGSLLDKINKKNYKFQEVDRLKIINWIENNLEIQIFRLDSDFQIEKHLISNYTPLLNDKNNPLALQELKDLKKKCRSVALLPNQ